MESLAPLAAADSRSSGSSALRSTLYTLLLVTLGIGLIHGFGFSFALRDLLDADGPNVLPALAGFNIGVELGQLAVGLAVFALFRWLRRWAAAERGARLAAVSVAMAAAMVWLIDPSARAEPTASAIKVPAKAPAAPLSNCRRDL